MKLSNNEISNIDVREDGYINITQLCKAGGKSFVEYNKVKQNQGYLEAISSFLRIPNTDLLDIKMSGTYAHPKVACHLAKWISSNFEEQILDFIEERESELPYIPEFKEFKLILSDGKEFLIPVRKDGYVNATLLCKSANKRLDNYYASKQIR